MLLMVMLLAILLTILGWYVARDLFAPCVAGPGIWAAIIAMYYIVPNNYFPICHDFPLSLSLWLVGFFIASVWAAGKTPLSTSVNKEPSKLVLRTYVVITITAIPLMSFMLLWKAFTEEPETMFRYLRVMAVGFDDNIQPPDFGPLVYANGVAYITLLFVMLYFKNKWVIGSVLFMNFLSAFVAMAKISFLTVLFTLMYVGYSRGLFKLKHMTYAFILFMVLCFFMQVAREGDGGDQVGIADTLSLYTTSAMVCFDYYAVPCSSLNFGEHVFRFFYAVGHSLGLCAEPAKILSDFVYIPEMANTYSVLYPFYIDFGNVGVLLFSLLYGAFYGFLYKKSLGGNKMLLILYAIFFILLLLEFFAEQIFTNLSMTIQYIVFAVIPFMIGKEKNNAEMLK